MKRLFLVIPLLLLSFCFIFSSKSFAAWDDCENATYPDYICNINTGNCSDMNKGSEVWTPAPDNNGNPIMCGPFSEGDIVNHPCCTKNNSNQVVVGEDTCVSTYQGFCGLYQNNCATQNATQVKNSTGIPVACDATYPCCRYNNVTGTDNLCRASGGTCLVAAPTYAYTILTSPPGCTIDADPNDPFCNLCNYNDESCYKQNITTYCGEGPYHNSSLYREENDYICYQSTCPAGHKQWDDSDDGEMRPCRQGSSWVCCTNFDTTGSEQANPNKLFCIPGNESSGINTAIGCIPVGSGNELITAILNIAIGLGGGIALALILYGVFIVTTSAGMPDKLKAGSEIITSAVVGLIFILLSIFLVNLIGINILGIPGLS